MPVAFDFGTCNTIIARWDEDAGMVRFLQAPELSRNFTRPADAGAPEEAVPVFPSLIHYGEQQQALAAQVLDSGLLEDPATLRWLKMDMLRRTRRTRRVGSQRIADDKAAGDLVSRLLMFACSEDDRNQDLVLSVPVEAYDHYVDWLTNTAASVWTRPIHLIDEASACILGYGDEVTDGDVYLIVDFGGGTLDISLVRTSFEAEQGVCRSRVLGRAGEEIGGMFIDQWLAAALEVADDDLRWIGTDLLVAAEGAKIELSLGRDTELSVRCEASGHLYSHSFKAADFPDLLAEHGFFELISTTVERSFDQAMNRFGVPQDAVAAVLLVGGTSLIPVVQDHIEKLFPGKVRNERPFSAIAAGACRYVQEDFSPAVVHDYCLRTWSAQHAAWEFTPVIARGTRYPTAEPVKAVYLNPAYDGQDKLGMLLYEVSDMVRLGSNFVVGGDGRLQRADPHAVERQQPLNPENDRFIQANPPCKRGDNRFVAAFGVDAEKRLTISLQDLLADNESTILPPNREPIPLPVRDFPVTRLSR